MSWITLALLMLPLIGHLRAAPLNMTPPDSLSMEAMGFRLLVQISCKKDLNFTSPTNVEDKCYNAALGHYLKEFQRAAADDNCSDVDDFIEMALEELERIYTKTQTACTLTMKTHTTFADFVDATRDFTQQYNSLFQRKGDQH